jgi:hypothetical protein
MGYGCGWCSSKLTAAAKLVDCDPWDGSFPEEPFHSTPSLLVPYHGERASLAVFTLKDDLLAEQLRQFLTQVQP